MHRRSALTAAAVVALALAGATYWIFTATKPSLSPVADQPREPVTELPTSPFLNTQLDVAYVGSETCRECHREQEESYRRTSMSRSMSAIDLAIEPPDGTFEHAISKRRYEVVRRDGQMWHRELALNAEPESLVFAEYPVRYVVGSGHHSRSYFIEAEGFLVESPITWYTATRAWGISPGYDRAEHLGFQRAAGDGCLVCHAGRSHAVGHSLHRMQVDEAAIGCERCHGPGALHVAKHRTSRPEPEIATKDIDDTIVNPAHLSRAESEAICQQCHLRSHATVLSHGKSLADFRPGLLLEQFAQHYRLDVPHASMTVVGHVEQLHLSPCYQASSTLSCGTCHNPHGEPEANVAAAHHNAACAACHEPAACRVDPDVRQRRSPENSCIVCHMPRSKTEIPHLAFTHHRIGIHDSDAVSPTDPEQLPQGLGRLMAFANLSHMTHLEQLRSLGLAYLETANRQHDPRTARKYREEAVERLMSVRGAAHLDGGLEAGLARLAFDLQEGPVAGFAQGALQDRALSANDRCNCLFLLADAAIQRGQHAEALPYVTELVTLRRHSVDWLMLADCLRKTSRDATEALETAVRIDPHLGNVHRYLADHFRTAGNAEKARWHEHRAAP
jgi:hypothetical protein